MKKPKRKAVSFKRAVIKRGVVVPAVDVLKVALPPDKVLHIETPPDHDPVVVLHPSKSAMTVAAVPKKKRTLMEWLFG